MKYWKGGFDLTDQAHEYTDWRILIIEKQLSLLYEKAYTNSVQKVKKRLKKLDTIKDPKKRQAQYYLLDRELSIVKSLARDMSKTNQQAASIINSERLNVFSENRNYTGWNIETQAGLNIDWTIYNRDSVARILRENPDLLPYVKIDLTKDIPWNMDKIREILTAGIIEGKTIPELAKDFKSVTNMNKISSVRNARTALAGAESLGRIDGMKYAESKGIDMVKVWSATLDGKTRPTHRAEDGQKVGINEKFPNTNLLCPGDPNGAAEEVYNCRCAVNSQVKGVDRVVTKRDNITGQIVSGMNYNEWYKARGKSEIEKQKQSEKR